MVKLVSRRIWSYSFIFLITSLVISGFQLDFSRPSNNLDSSEVEVSTSGYSDVDLSFIPEIDYNSLNKLWYEPKIEMLIVSPNQSDFINALIPLRDDAIKLCSPSSDHFSFIVVIFNS